VPPPPGASAPEPVVPASPPSIVGSGGGAGAAGGDIIGLLATGLQFAGASFGSASATVGLFTEPVLNPGLLLALAMDGPAGLAVYGELFGVAGQAGEVALELGGDALALAGGAAALITADSGFFTDPLVTVPLGAAEGRQVRRRVELRVGGSVSFRGITVPAGATIVVEYLDNGLVRVTVKGRLTVGAEYSSEPASTTVAGGPVGSVSWLLPDGHDASRLVVLLAAGGAGLPAAAGLVTPIPLPQQYTTGWESSTRGGVGPGGVPLAKGSVIATGQVTFDVDGNRSYEFSLAGSANSSIAGPILEALPSDVRARLPGGNLAEGAFSGSINVKTDEANNVESVTLKLEGSFGRGVGVDTPVGDASAASGKKYVVEVELKRADLVAMGADGRRVLEALANHRPDQAASALADLGERLAREADVHEYDYTRVDGTVGIKKGGTGADVSAGATVETLERSSP